MITEFHYVSESGGPAYMPGYPSQMGIYSDVHLEGAKKIAQALKNDGNKAVMQIHHGGRMAIGRFINHQDVVAPSDLHVSSLFVLLLKVKLKRSLQTLVALQNELLKLALMV